MSHSSTISGGHHGSSCCIRQSEAADSGCHEKAVNCELLELLSLHCYCLEEGEAVVEYSDSGAKIT